ncbi:MAG: hypothetical protein MI757_16670 [Pirellulales bacterium]|nr:hypothetical protein [Pirellulales bacterium]
MLTLLQNRWFSWRVTDVSDSSSDIRRRIAMAALGIALLFALYFSWSRWQAAKIENANAWLNDADVRIRRDRDKQVVMVDLSQERSKERNLNEKLVHLQEFPVLTHVYLRNPSLTDAGMRNLRGLTNVTDLDLRDTKITDVGLKNLKGMKSIERVFLTSTETTDAGLTHLKRLKSLREIALDGTKVTEEGLAYLSELPSLAKLTLGNVVITDVGLSHLKKMAQLRELFISGESVTPEMRERLRTSLPGCTVQPEP